MALGLLGLQFGGMVLFSLLQYRRYGLTNDFAGYAQAWNLIGHGHLNPYVSVFRVDFLHNNFDLAMYPLAWVGRLVGTPVMLSWAQDLAVVATEVVVLGWALEIFAAHRPALGRLYEPSIVLVGLLLAFNPWSWETAAFSLHFEAFATFFAVLAARDLWRGRYWSLALWVPLAAGAESLGGLYLLAAGLGALASRRLERRRRAAGLVVAMLGMLGLVLASSLHLIGRGGTTFNNAYSYLVGHHSGPVGPGTLVAAIAAHFPAAVSMLVSHLPYVIGYIIAGGTVGFFSAWGLAAVVVIILPNALSGELPFIAFPGAFQSWPAEPFLVIGSVLVLVGWASRRAEARPLTAHNRRVVALLLVPTLTLSVLQLVTMPRRWMPSSEMGSQLAAIESLIPADAEVVANQNDIGRFAMGRSAFDYVKAGDTVPLVSPTVVVIARKIADDSGRRIIDDLAAELRGSRILFDGSTFRAYLWTKPEGADVLRI